MWLENPVVQANDRQVSTHDGSSPDRRAADRQQGTAVLRKPLDTSGVASQLGSLGKGRPPIDVGEKGFAAWKLPTPLRSLRTRGSQVRGVVKSPH